jgi:putative peptide zinc metalloprotease protein
MAVLAIPIAGIVLMLWKFGSQIVKWTVSHTQGHPIMRTGAALVGVAAMTVLAMSWIPKHSYRPIQRGERGTVADGLADVRHIRTAGPVYSATKQAPVAASSSATSPQGTTTPADSTTPTTAASTAGGTTATTARSSTATTSTTIESTTTTAPESAITSTTVP